MNTQLFGVFLLSVMVAASPLDAEAAEPGDVEAKGTRFLEGLLDPELSLLPEFAGSSTYWVYHDNYLAAKWLARAGSPLAAKVAAAIHQPGRTNHTKVEILFFENPRPLPFYGHRLVEIRREGSKIIKDEWTLPGELKGWEEYADLCFWAAIAESKSHPERARARLAAGLAMWDGHGFKDRVTRGNGLYATYKLALGLLAARACGWEFPEAGAVRERLLALRHPDGGWFTDYRADGSPAGLANVETTCLALFALDREFIPRAEAGRRDAK